MGLYIGDALGHHIGNGNRGGKFNASREMLDDITFRKDTLDSTFLIQDQNGTDTVLGQLQDGLCQGVGWENGHHLTAVLV